MKTLVIDVGGTHIKMLASGKRTPRKFDSGPSLTPRAMARRVLEETDDWEYDCISIGFPAPVRDNHPTKEPWNLGRGWVKFDYTQAFSRPVRMINDAAMQALGSYRGGNMLFLGLGTGLGTTIIRDRIVVPLELAHLPYREDKTYEDYLGVAGLERLGKHKWRKHVLTVIDLFLAALEVDYVILGGGNARHMNKLPKNVHLGSNANAFKGGFRLWET
jgi:polyphosphate glucokinase